MELLSPYSIQAALAMTYVCAASDTRAEMAKVLHYPADEALTPYGGLVAWDHFWERCGVIDEVARKLFLAAHQPQRHTRGGHPQGILAEPSDRRHAPSPAYGMAQGQHSERQRLAPCDGKSLAQSHRAAPHPAQPRR